MNKTKALVVLSGGQDSVTCLYLARMNYDEVYAVTFNYGQRHAIELQAAQQVALMAKCVNHEVVKLPDGILQGSSPLVNHGNRLETYDNFAEMDRIIGSRRELTFVPMRNMLFLTIAANRAEVMGIDTIITGVCSMDNANYSDCRPNFINAVQFAVNLSNGADEGKALSIKIAAPLLYHTKAESVWLAHRIPGAWDGLAYSHTCYAGESPPCGKCHSCVLRAQGFLEAGLPDPLITRHFDEGNISLPSTMNYSFPAIEKGLTYAK